MGVTRLEIDLKALKHNYSYLRAKVADNIKMMAVVKAFGYGSDACEIALFLEKLGVDYFAVAYADEGEILRKAGVKTPILVLHPQPDNFNIIIEHCLEPSLYSARVFKEFSAFAKAQQQKNYPVHLKFNTGLNRLGFWENDTDWILERLKETTTIKVASIFSHLVASEDPKEREFTQHQIASFTKIAATFLTSLDYTPFLHQSNTSAIINYPEAQFDMVRAGIGLYGYGNSPEEDAHLQPVASLISVISQIHAIEPGESVGYNRAYKATHYEKTATIPIGHADGISRAYGQGKGYVTINGQKAPIVGNVCMDMLMVNITDIDCKEGDDVVVFGKGASAVDLSATIHSISYELLTAVSQRVKRVVLR
ncbi:alanine racemase [uncultured Dokdonia sp.]|uniref:alanine racemase n=1 Tax=uncultured Dokdonia sp. TaxID=575653 RepID=UPI002607EA06|nr:alanine racemase [uncultured Dokdonia sp.]